MRLIAVVLGAANSADRFDTAAQLLEYGFANCKLYPVAKHGTRVRGKMPVSGGRPDAIPLELRGDLTLLTMKGAEDHIRLLPELPEEVQAPIQVGDEVGCVRVESDGRTLARLPVVAAEASELTGFSVSLRRVWQNWLIA